MPDSIDAARLADQFGSPSENCWSIHEQGLISKNLIFDVARHNDGFSLTFKTQTEHWQIFFSPGGQITHARHHGTPTLATTVVEHDLKDAIRPGHGAA